MPENMKPSLVGSWVATITAIGQGVTFPALLSFTSDGIVIASEPPGPFESTGQGNWISTGPLDAAFTFFFLFGSAEGKLSGKFKVNNALHYDPGIDSWSGTFKLWGWDGEGNPTVTEQGTITCSRIMVEPLD
jgi:hypothetical protein